MKILVIASHPDDEVLGCGGTIALRARQEHDVHIMILGEGITSRCECREQANAATVASLGEKSRLVGEFLGAKTVEFFQLPDNRFDTVPLLDIVKIIEEAVGRLSPQVIYTQHGDDLNIDHVITYRATLTATRPLASCPVMKVLAYEVPSATDWAFRRFGPGIRPNVFVDIHETLSMKLRAMEMYESEARPFPHPRSMQALEANARRWGSVVGVAAAEAFELVRSLE